MTQIAEELDAKLKELGPFQARYLESLVREALSRAEQMAASPTENDWPPGYFEATSGALAGEDFERPPQGSLPKRGEW